MLLATILLIKKRREKLRVHGKHDDFYLFQSVLTLYYNLCWNGEGLFTPNVSVDASATALIENHGVASKWIATLFWSDSIDSNESSSVGVIIA